MHRLHLFYLNIGVARSSLIDIHNRQLVFLPPHVIHSSSITFTPVCPFLCHDLPRLTNPRLPIASGSGEHQGPAASLPARQTGAGGPLRVSPAGPPVECPGVPAARPAAL